MEAENLRKSTAGLLKNINNPGLFVNPDQTSIPIGGLMSILNILKLPEVIEVII